MPPQTPPKAYKNLDFLNSGAARKIRVLCEMSEPEARFAEENVEDTIVLFGSARIQHPDDAAKRLVDAKASLTVATDVAAQAAAEKELLVAKTRVKAAPYYTAAHDLAASLSQWSKSLTDKQRRFIICSGGGPGIMEAANRGAKSVGGASIGLGISLPFEQGLNAYISPDLGFEFHYFFIRKYWFAYLAKALVVFPGGFGTMDELFECLTLIQTRKIQKTLPIVLFGREFWDSILNFEAFVEWGVISPEDLSLFHIMDDVEEAHQYIVDTLTAAYELK